MDIASLFHQLGNAARTIWNALHGALFSGRSQHDTGDNGPSMRRRREHYVVVVRFSLNVALPGDDSIRGVPVPIQAIQGALTIALNGSPQQTEIEIRWEFDDWFTEDSEQDIQTSRIEKCKQFGALFVPDEKPGFEHDKMITGESLIYQVRPYFARLALASRTPSLWSRLRFPDLDQLKPTMFFEVAGHSIHVTLKPSVFWATPHLAPKAVGVDVARQLALAVPPRYAQYLLAADQRRFHGDTADAVVHLAQGLEIAAYDFARPLGVRAHFSAKVFFGPPGGGRHGNISARNPSLLHQYPQICELFGARHEWIHEGRAEVRIFDVPRSDVDPNNRRKLALTDYDIFRSAASSALVWMGELPIE